jgi:hypothetical protein
MSKYPQLTLGELMLGVLLIGLGCAGLLAGGMMATIFLGAMLIVTIGFAIVAFVGRDEPRAAAVGFLVVVIAYAASILAVSSAELDPYEGKLPTTKLIQPAFRLVVRSEWINVVTGEPMPDFDPSNPGPYGAIGPSGPPVGLKETPDRTTFMSVAHTFLAMVFGYVGMKFAAYVYRRHNPQVKAANSE